MRRLALLSLALFIVVPAVAQPIPPDGCTRTGYATMFTDAAFLLGADESADDPDILESSLNFYLSTIQTRRAQCAGLAFDGETGGVVIGPFTLPAGNWLHEGAFNDYAVTNIETLTPECRSQLIGSGLTSSSREAYTDQTFIQTDTDCRLVIEVTASKPWVLTFTPVS